MKFKKPKGTKDILPKDIHKWHFVEKTIHEAMQLYNFSEIRTPTFENTELFTRGIGSETPLVGKEMYSFNDKGGNSITLRAEMTAPVMRAYVENGLFSESLVHKLYYISNIFRYENPQKGRFREHTQFGAEIIGSDNVYSDIEIIRIAQEIYLKCGIKNFSVNINSIGKIGERRDYIAIFKDYLINYFNDLSDDSRRRFETNPLRILDSKDIDDIKITENAPKILDHLSKNSKDRFEKVLQILNDIHIDYILNFRLVRGFDYYTDTTFEFISEDLGAQNAIGGGGRYDGLCESIGGKPTPGVGFAAGLERMIIVAEKNNFDFAGENNVKVYVITLNDEAKRLAVNISSDLRNSGISCEYDLLNRSMKAQMREANKLNVEYVCIIGEEEIKKGKAIIKNMADGSQNEITYDKIIKSILRIDEN